MLKWLATSVTIPVSPETKPMLEQFLSRPSGFGVLETFCPIPANKSHLETVKTRKLFWGCTRDWHYDGYSPRAKGIAAQDVSFVTFCGPRGMLQAIVSLFGGGVRLGLPNYEESQPEDPVTSTVVARWAAARNKRQLGGADAYEIFKPEWHQCRHCNKRLPGHANGQCLFGSTKFTPWCTEWRTLIGDFSWDPKSGLFVKTAGSTTTTTTTTAARVRVRPSKATAAREKPAQPRRPKTSTESAS